MLQRDITTGRLLRIETGELAKECCCAEEYICGDCPEYVTVVISGITGTYSGYNGTYECLPNLSGLGFPCIWNDGGGGLPRQNVVAFYDSTTDTFGVGISAVGGYIVIWSKDRLDLCDIYGSEYAMSYCGASAPTCLNLAAATISVTECATTNSSSSSESSSSESSYSESSSESSESSISESSSD